MTGIFDADIHNAPRTPGDLKRYLPQRSHRYWDQDYPRTPGRALHWGAWQGWSLKEFDRPDAAPPGGGAPASDLEFFREQHLDQWGIDFALLNPLANFSSGTGEFGDDLARAINEWDEREWLDREPRLLASIAVPFESADLAVREIERLAGHGRFVAIEMPVLVREPLGHPKYWPIYECASARTLPLIVHVAGSGGVPTTGGVGWGSYYIESHTGWTYAFQSQVVSLVRSGVLERFPGLQIVLTEGGLCWMASLMWRLDRSWRLMPDQWPGIRHEPSRYIREHFWFTTQPIDEPERPEYLLQTLEQIGMNDRILFSSDYPHWDFDAPDLALPRQLPEALRSDILRRNARVLFPATSAR